MFETPLACASQGVDLLGRTHLRGLPSAAYLSRVVCYGTEVGFTLCSPKGQRRLLVPLS